MNNLELSTFGIQELEANAMLQVEGGFIPLAVLLGIWAFQGAVFVGGMTLLTANK